MPSTAARLSVWAPALTVPVIVEAVADNALGAIDAAAVASAEGDAVEIVSSTEAVLHRETDPLAIATGAQGGAIRGVAEHVLFQTDLVSSAGDARVVELAGVRQGGDGCRYNLVGGRHR